METVWIVAALLLGYAFGACLMQAFWSRIPPTQFFGDILMGVIWPAGLVLVVGAGTINAIFRAMGDKDGTVGGLIKDLKWHRHQQERKEVKEQVHSP